jgi:DNA-binding winged helix-turn-helix (wHTH) protein
MASMPMKAGEIFQFGKFQIDARARHLRREEEEEEIVTLNYRAFDLLLYPLQDPGKVFTRNKLLENVWRDTYVDENDLAHDAAPVAQAYLAESQSQRRPARLLVAEV